jgi:hypothetical protein
MSHSASSPDAAAASPDSSYVTKKQRSMQHVHEAALLRRKQGLKPKTLAQRARLRLPASSICADLKFKGVNISKAKSVELTATVEAFIEWMLQKSSVYAPEDGLINEGALVSAANVCPEIRSVAASVLSTSPSFMSAEQSLRLRAHTAGYKRKFNA